MFQSCLNYKERTSKYVADFFFARPVLWISAPWARWPPGVSGKKTHGNSMKPLEIREEKRQIFDIFDMSTRSRSFNKCCWISFKQIHMASEVFFPQVLICRLLEGSFQLGFWEILQCSRHRWDRIDKVTPHQTAEVGRINRVHINT